MYSTLTISGIYISELHGLVVGKKVTKTKHDLR